ncbi:ABC1-domain-containing protein [Daedalea quercina L-15889]|uniref:ABC1-domain-containing protein n=1 Tax=Daedalea quercina L-15889 TaxID=1314783 RepID=A0A165QP42_9APHY|nr:ABC1-domain-containing protein [Daedalea quercina L-15889]
MLFSPSRFVASSARTHTTRPFRSCPPGLSSRPINSRSYTSPSHSTLPNSRADFRIPKYARRSLYFAGTLGVLYFADTEFNASSVTRNLRTFWTCAMIALDYKLNFTPELSDQIPALHARVADLVYDLFTSNGGLYIKIGQAFANNAALMPAPMQEKFAKLFDDAPQVAYSVVDKVFRREFGRPPAGPDGVFEVFEERAAASASIAQVHRAKLKPEDGGHWVAVKIQKPDVGKQVEWDLGAYRIVMWIYEKYIFDMPVYFTVDFICDHLRRELDFELEAKNAQETAHFVAAEPRLADKVYVPKVFPALSTKKVMVAEWIDGVRLSDRRAIRALMGEGPPADAPALPARGPLKGGVKWIMNTMVELFSAQIFDWGWVHCDPHPGNIFVRQHPRHPGRPQFVLLDHGLYVRLPRPFQRQYATLWKGLMTLDYAQVEAVATEWGIGETGLFASATLMRPVRLRRRRDRNQGTGESEQRTRWDQMSEYERSVQLKERLRKFLTDTDKIPKELIFVGRNMRIVQGNNQQYGSPVNRIRITGWWASRSLAANPSLTFTERLREYRKYLGFLLAMSTLDLAFFVTRVRQWIQGLIGLKGEGFEDELERTMRGLAKTNFGIEITQGAFEG